MTLSPTFRTLGLVLLLIGGGRVTYDRLRTFSQIDPFAAFRAPKQTSSDNVAVILEGVKMRDYRSGKLVAKADAGRIEVGKDRRSFTLFDIKDGLAPTKEGPAKFTARRAYYDSVSKVFSVTDKGTVQGKNYALNSNNLIYDENRKTLRADMGVNGKIFQGDAGARVITMNTDTGAFKMMDPRWAGDPGQISQEVKGAKKWNIRAAVTEYDGKDISIHTDGSATDGEILVKGPKIEHVRSTDVITSTGRSFYYSAKANIVADKIVVYRKEKRAVLTGNVILLSKPTEESTDYEPKEEPIPGRPDLKADAMEKPVITNGPTAEEKELDKQLRDGKTIRRFPLLIGADKVVYWYQKGERRAEITGNPQARQEIGKGVWRHIWTYEAFYDGEKETLLAKSSEGKKEARMKNSKGDDMTAREFFLHTKEGDDRYSGKDFLGDIVSDEETENGEAEPTPPVRIGGKAETGSPTGPTKPPVKPPGKR
ncbi:hypothetical protein EON81_25110 [bacterium]|nr:MAG: hypothetical protein EON81_25110 [bacterium]